MRKFALIAAAAGLAVSGSLVKADFVFTTTRTTDAAGTTFAGDDRVTLTVLQNSTGTVQGTLISFNLTESSTASSPKFFIRTFNLSATNGTTFVGPAWASAGPNPNADLLDQGEQDDVGGNRPGTAGSSARLGAGSTTFMANVAPLSTTPAESGTFTDGQSLTTFNVQAGEGSTNGIPVTSARTLAIAVVPAGQQVTFSGIVSSKNSANPALQGDQTFNVTDPVPEPASLGLLGIGAAGLVARRRRTA